MDALRFALSHRAETVALTRESILSKADDPRPAHTFDDALKRGLVDATIPLPPDKLAWMQNELVKAGNLKTPIDLAEITDAEYPRRGGKATEQLVLRMILSGNRFPLIRDSCARSSPTP